MTRETILGLPPSVYLHCEESKDAWLRCQGLAILAGYVDAFGGMISPLRFVYDDLHESSMTPQLESPMDVAFVSDYTPTCDR